MLKRNIIYICMTMLMLLSFTGCGTPETKQEQGDEKEENLESTEAEKDEVMKIKVTSKEYEIVYELNESKAAKDLYAQLPLTLEVKDFSTNEKTFYPPEKLDISDAPLANAEKGSLCYYSPWADVVMFYDYLGQGSSLYELGKVVSGKDEIEKMNGTITVEAYQN